MKRAKPDPRIRTQEELLEVDGDLDTLAAARARHPSLRDPATAAIARRLRAEAIAMRDAATSSDERDALDQMLARIARLEALTGEGAS